MRYIDNHGIVKGHVLTYFGPLCTINIKLSNEKQDKTLKCNTVILAA